MKKIALFGVLLVFSIALLAETVSAGTYYYGGQPLYSDYGYYGGNGYYGSNYGYAPNPYYQGYYASAGEPYLNYFPDGPYYYRTRAPSDSYWRSQTWGGVWDYGNAMIYDKITYEHNEYYDFQRARAYGYGGGSYSSQYLNPAYYSSYDGYYFSPYGTYKYW